LINVRLEFPDHLKEVESAVQAFLAKRLPLPASPAAHLSFLEALQERGWSAPLWPRRWGGGDFSVAEAFVIDRTLTRAGAPVPDPLTVDLLGPLLMARASETDCQRWLPDMAMGAVRWCGHGSLFGGLPLTGRLENGKFLASESRIRAANAVGAQALVAMATDGQAAALVMTALDSTMVVPGLPLDPDLLLLEGCVFEVLASATDLAALRADISRIQHEPAAAGRSWSGRLRYLLARLKDEDAGNDPETSALEIAVTGLEVTEMRVLAAESDPEVDSAGDPEPQALGLALAVRGAELGRALAEKIIASLGYYALPAPDPSRQHNEVPLRALAAQDAVAELIRYLEADVVGYRDRLSRFVVQGTVR
jgi:hypothetical protein